jgi:hypothetical protein
MATTPNTNVSTPSKALSNAFRTDMFGRTKVSEPFTLFDSTHRYTQNGDFSDVVQGTASSSHIEEQSTAALTVGTDSGDYLHRESRRVFSYQPGKSLQVLQTFVLAPAKTNLRQRVGYFSTHNGTYLELDGDQLSIVKRTFANSIVEEVRVPQADWNIDKLDGSGPSDVVLDPSKAQIMFSEYEWLGVGSVRIGFAIDGRFIEAHQFNHANYLDSVYMTTATLPVRFEIENTGDTDSPSTLKQICVSVISNGGYDRRTIPHIVDRLADVNVDTTPKPIVSIRMASGRTDSVIIPSAISVLPSSDDAFVVRLYKNATLTGGTWVPNGSANVESNNTATAMSGGEIIGEFFIEAGKNSKEVLDVQNIANFQMQLGRSNASTPGGAVSDVLTLAARTISKDGKIIGSLSYYDLL